MDYEGHLIQLNSSIYLIIHHQRHLITNADVFDRLFITRERIVYVDQQNVEKYQEGHPFSDDTILVKDMLNDRVYLDDGCQLYECSDIMIYNSGLKWLDINKKKRKKL